jgi:acetylornithine deacetylase/succinyl-diaminopimelate desuccinylase-like protein
VREGFTDIQARRLGGFPAHKTPVNNWLVKMLTRASEQVHGCAPAYEPLASASSVRYLLSRRRPIPIVGVGIGYPASNIGRPNEHIRTRDFQKGIEFITATILECASARASPMQASKEL